MNKKGIFFTFGAIALSVIIILSFNVHNEYRLNDKMDTVGVRINTMNSFIEDLENDAENAIFIAGFRSLLSLEDYMFENDDFLDNLGTTFQDAFKGAFLNGTIDSQKMDIMKGHTFFNWTERMKVQANQTDIELEFTLEDNDVTISQSGPWIVDVTVDLEVDIQDRKKTASWEIDKPITKKINITGFVDPLYLVNNNGLVNNTITETTVDPSSSAANLNTHLINSYYIEHSDAPSYIMRFENDLSSSSYGIESLVNSQERIDAGLSALTRSAVDYIYYGSQSTTDCVIRDPSYSWFYLDSDHLDFYDARCD